jgi:hypothetical protein
MSSKDGKPIATDVILPHLGTVFGLSEQATLLFLVKVGCCQAKGEGCIINPKGWDDLAAEFKAKSHIEVSKTSFDKRSDINLIRLGFLEHKPAVIWRTCKQGETKAPPRAISSHASAKFARTEFTNVFKGSKLHMDVLRHHVGSCVKEDGIHASALKCNAWCEDDEVNVHQASKRRRSNHQALRRQ